MADMENLLEWMREKPRLFSWDMIGAMNRDKLNRLLAQVYISRFNGNGYRKPFTALIEIESEQRRYLQDFVLDMPRLAFSNLDLNDSRAALSMRIISGSDVAVQERAGGREISRLEWIQPMQGPLLSLMLRLENVGGEVADDCRLLLDLSQSDDFELDFDADANVRQLGGGGILGAFQKAAR